MGTHAGFYIGVQYQKGYGLSATLGHFVLPIIKPVAKTIGVQVLKVAPALVMDVLAGKPPVKVLSKRFHQEASNVLLELTGKKQMKRKKAKIT